MEKKTVITTLESFLEELEAAYYGEFVQQVRKKSMKPSDLRFNG